MMFAVYNNGQVLGAPGSNVSMINNLRKLLIMLTLLPGAPNT